MTPLLNLATLLSAGLAAGTAVAQPARTMPAGTAGEARPLSPLTAQTVERLELGAGHGLELRVDPLDRRIELRQASGAALTVGRSRLCPQQSRTGPWTALHCLRARFSASLDPRGGLNIVELRGLPLVWDDSGPPRFFYDPADPRLPLRCPGNSPAAIGECALRDGKLAAAAAAFAAVPAAAVGAAYAAMRRGDLAEMAGNPDRALAEYDEASHAADAAEPLLSLLQLRRCELTGECPPTVLLPGGHGTQFRREAQLRLARFAAFRDRLKEMLELLEADAAAPVEGAPFAVANDQAEGLRRRLVLVALGSGDDDAAARGLQLYLRLPRRLKGPDAARLARAAAEAASRLGVPRFGAHLLAAVFPGVAPAAREEHLLRTVELYLAGGDLPHAEAILDFARTKVPAPARRTARWLLAEREVSGTHLSAKAPAAGQAARPATVSGTAATPTSSAPPTPGSAPSAKGPDHPPLQGAADTASGGPTPTDPSAT